MKRAGVLVEVTTLVIPGLNDSPDELQALADFIVAELDPGTPWHISRFHPTYRLLDRPPTPIKTLVEAREIGIRSGLRYVYMGNVPGEGGEQTHCPGCGKIVIDRWGFKVLHNRVANGCCSTCGALIDGIFQQS
jgi:pyruvate formate lyase activating enzyme